VSEWSRPTARDADVVVHGDDAALARALTDHHGALIAFEPDAGSDLARTLGLATTGSGTTEVALDVLRLRTRGGERVAVNAVVIGTPPRRTRWWTRAKTFTVIADGARAFAGRATGVVVATGQYIGPDDTNPRSHPGDGRAEVYVFALRRGERRGLRHRLLTGTHVPHPRILRRSSRAITITASAALPVLVDGVAPPVEPGPLTLEITVDPAALHLIV